jgi:hypothetical protein
MRWYIISKFISNVWRSQNNFDHCNNKKCY